MPNNIAVTAQAITRHALNIALVYLLICGLPAVLMFITAALPMEQLRQLADDPLWGQILRFFYPVRPIQTTDLPFRFQDSLGVLPALLIETLMVFMFSSWQLRRKPWLTTAKAGKLPWLLLILLVGGLSWKARMLWLHHINEGMITQLMKLQESAKGIDQIDQFLQFSVLANQKLTAIIYATMPLWALIPLWLYFLVVSKRTHAQPAADASAIPESRSTLFAGFWLGFAVLHTVFLLATYTWIWPWAADEARIALPLDTLQSMDLPLTLGQIVFSLLFGALAAWIFARRPHSDQTSFFQIVIKPVLAGIITYLLTCLIILALFWIAVYLDPSLSTSLVRSLELHPDTSLVFIIGLNLLCLFILCISSSGMRASPAHWASVTAVLAVLLAIPAWVIWVLVSTNQGIAGNRPGMAMTGTLGDAKWRSMEQWCTGVVETKHGTWLVGRRDERESAPSDVPEGTPNLAAQIYPDGQPKRRSLFSSDPVLTTLSLLQKDGTFKLMATVPVVACLQASPESDTLFLFTALDRPETSSYLLQDVVFRSTDQGTTWEMLEDGFIAKAGTLAWGDRPVFASEQEVWAWGKEPPSEDDEPSIWGTPAPAKKHHAADGTELKETGLFYSADQGKTATRIYSPEQLVAPNAYLRKQIGADGARADLSGRRSMDREHYVVQVDAQHAYAWVSERLWYRAGEDSRRLYVLTRATLTRPNADSEWQVVEVVRQPDMHLTNVSTSADGRTYATLMADDREWLARLDPETGEWTDRHETPTLLPRWLAKPDMTTRYFQNNGDYQVVGLWGDVIVPRLLIPFSKEASEISVDAHFYTDDGGRSWHQLAIPGYLGVMGLSPRGSKLYWSKGDWYRNDEPEQWEYDLAQ